MNPSSFLLSVDLGTSHAVAVLRWPDGRTRPLLFDGQPVLPVGVYCDEAGELHVGRDAARLSAVSPERFEPYPKRRVGQGSVLLADREVAVAAMFAAALRRIAVVCAQATGTLPETVLTCPSSWSSARRKVLAGAAALAGFGPVRLVTEPVAAAYYYRSVLGRSVAAGGALAVVDFGAGTVDVAVVASEGGGPSIVAEGGVEDFGGVDLDAAVVDHLRAATLGDHAGAWGALDDPRSGSQLRGRLQLWADVRETKEMLSRFTVAPVSVPGIEAGLHLTRPELDAVARPLLERVVAEVVRVRDAAAAAGHPVGAVFLVGGASRMPLAATMIHDALGVAPVVVEQPELAVAEGAAVDWVEAAAEAPVAYSPVPVEESTPPTIALGEAPAEPARKVRPWTVAVAASALIVLAAALLVVREWLPGGGGAAEEAFVTAVTGTAEQACPEGQSTLDAPGVLAGPHFTLAPSCLAVLEPDAVDTVAGLLGEAPDLDAGERLALVHFPAEGAVPALPDGSAYAVATVVSLGEAVWEVAGVPEADTVYAAVVAEDVALTVAVTDADRTQTLDLATGEVADPVGAYYHGEFGEREFTFESHLSMESPGGDWVIEGAEFDAGFTVTRAVFDEAGGWLCEPDQALVTAVFTIQVDSSAYEQDWPFDAAQQVRVVAAGETLIPRTVDHEDEQRDSGAEGEQGTWRTFTVEFAVPADAVDLQFEVDPHDRAYDETIDTWLYTVSGGETKHYTVTFGP
ncbi:Hsp70 family protein [Glycomyces paridis]|uniref:Hsp70 family protein n=1 Tax=Glycomyces paridis TaxID=2126555 RepID=A0A4S8PFG2_9ACTN|nr:Hsp70 family protein [Glycomyces paridis]THV28062.1 Hsp70 family protein [Glycomyces paridis]